MIAILTDNCSVGRDIARIVKATKKENGYLSGNNYMVTWPLGHLAELARPHLYGIGRPHQKDLPIIPDPFKLSIKQKRGHKGWIDDSDAVRQLKIIGQVFDRCERIVVATDPGAEGELLFRYIYNHLQCSKPFLRLWIHSLTDEAIREGLQNLRPGAQYDHLYRAAQCRAKADWLVGVNASHTFGLTCGMGSDSLGRVHTPTLAMICKRHAEHTEFKPSIYWELNIAVQKEDNVLHLALPGKFDSKEEAEMIYQDLKANETATVMRISKVKSFEAPPLLHDLTSLQIEANERYALTADQTLTAAQSLYEKKLVSYPRTTNRYISGDLFKEIPELLQRLAFSKLFTSFVSQLDYSKLSTGSVNSDKVSDHHALITTGVMPVELNQTEMRVYMLIASRIVEAFMPRCMKLKTEVFVSCGNYPFSAVSTSILSPGWRAVNWENDAGPEESNLNHDLLNGLAENEVLKLGGVSLTQRHTVPKPLYTEATLLTAMQTAGKELSKTALKKISSISGIGTPATRAAGLETLIAQGYIERSGRYIVPTEKGMFVYEAVKDMRIADAELAASYEKSLADIEQNKSSTDTFMRAMTTFTRQITEEILSIKSDPSKQKAIACPKCRSGRMLFRYKCARCSKPDCGLTIPRKFMNKELTDAQLKQLCTKGKTRIINGLAFRNGKQIDARLVLSKTYRPVLIITEFD